MSTAPGLSALSALEREALARYVQRLREALGQRFVRAVLFGSRARGEGHEESDLDVAVVVRGADWQLFAQVSDLATGLTLEYDYGVRLAPLLLSEEGVKDLVERELTLGRAITEEGIPL